ncbi:MAG: hypothetical protein KA955_07365 [Prevotella sp.]|nr:hypothetical protein [Prevotella sp.]
MKKIIFATPLLALLFVACDPISDNNGPGSNVTADELTSELQLKPKSAGNNNITFVTSPARYIKVFDSNTQKLLSEGTAPVVQVVPPNPAPSFYVEAINPDGTVVKSSVKTVTVTEYTDLPNIYYKIFGDDLGTTKWSWDTTASDGVWGNGAYLENTGPGWWVVQASDLDEQATGKSLPEDGLSGWMTLSLSGVNTSRGETGSISVTEDIVKANWDIGTMTFNGTIPLLGIQPNKGNARQYVYQILKADGNYLRLCASEPGAGDWGTAWFWNFKKQ